MKLKSWQTTLGGVIASIGAGMALKDDPWWLKLVGTIVHAAGLLIMGTSAQDENKTAGKAVKETYTRRPL